MSKKRVNRITIEKTNEMTLEQFERLAFSKDSNDYMPAVRDTFAYMTGNDSNFFPAVDVLMFIRKEVRIVLHAGNTDDDASTNEQ